MLMKRTVLPPGKKEDGSRKTESPFSFFRLPAYDCRLPREPDEERGAAIQAPGLFARVVVLRPFLAVAYGREPAGGDTPADEVVAHRIGATLTEGHVVFRRADVARVAFDLDADVGVALQHRDRLVERAHRFGPQTVAVEVEVHVFEDDGR